MKNITFVTGKDKGKVVMVARVVKIEELEGTAKELAEQIDTTRNSLASSTVYVRCPKIDMDFMEKMYKEFRKEFNEVRDVFGEEALKEGPIMKWKCDDLRKNEEPEQYFRRHAKRIDKAGCKIIDNKGELYMSNNNLKNRTVWVTTYSDVEIEEIRKAREFKIKKDEVTFNVCSLDFNNEFYFMGYATELISAVESGIPVKLVEFDENDFINIKECGFFPDQLTEFTNLEGNIRVGDIFEKFNWEGDTFKIDAEVIKGKPAYTFTSKEQEMKISTPFESGVAIHQAYIDLGMTEESDIDIYMQHYISKRKNIK